MSAAACAAAALPRREAWRRWLGAVMLLWAAGAWAQPAPAPWPQVVVLEHARLSAWPEGAAPEAPREVKLSHRWDRSHPGRGGRALYEITLPALRVDEPAALLFTRVGNQVSIALDGEPLAQMGRLGDPWFDAAKATQLVTVPQALLAREGPHRLSIEVTIQPSRWGGLSRLQFGSLAQLQPVHETHRLWRNQAMLALALLLALMGLAALALWWPQRRALYGWFAAGALLGTLKFLDRWLPFSPLPWPAWGALVAASLAAHLALMLRTGQSMLDEAGSPLPGRWAQAERALAGLALTLPPLLGAWALLTHRPRAWDLGLMLLLPYGLAVAAHAGWAAWRRRSRVALGLLGLLAFALASGIYDLFSVRLGLAESGGFSLMPLATVGVVAAMGAWVLRQHNATVHAMQRLQSELTQRVQEREQALEQTFQALKHSEREQAVLQERQRLMREIHDGVGAQLVGLINLAHKGRAPPEEIAAHASMALDEMRMAVDSLQPVHGDLATVLATLRYRLQPRLAAADLAIEWDMPPLPPMPNLSPEVVLQLQRIVLEAFTNVLRHAQARRLRIRAWHESEGPGRVCITVEDDGVGLPPPQARSGGHGLANMAARAAAIGAQFTLEPAPGGGTRVRLDLPLPAAPGAG